MLKRQMKAQDINLLQIKHFQRIAEMRLTKEQCQRQIETMYNFFKELRIKQKFINELKFYIELKSMSEQELKVMQIDSEQYKHLLSKKAQLMHQIYIKNEHTAAKNEMFLRNDLSIKHFERFFNIEGFNKHYEYPLQQLMKAINEIVTSHLSKQCEQIQSKMLENQQQNQSIIKRIQILKNSIQQKRNRLNKLQENISSTTCKQNDKARHNIIQLVRNSDHNNDVQQLMEKQKAFLQILSYKQSRQSTGIRERLETIKQHKLKLKGSYSQLTQKYRKLHLNIDKYLKKQVIIPRLRSTSEYNKQVEEFKELKEKCRLIKEKKRMLQQKQAN